MKRQCLKCGKEFESEWAGHRLCRRKRCKSGREWQNLGKWVGGPRSATGYMYLPGPRPK